jgi:hypothetical protein
VENILRNARVCLFYIRGHRLRIGGAGSQKGRELGVRFAAAEISMELVREWER